MIRFAQLKFGILHGVICPLGREYLEHDTALPSSASDFFHQFYPIVSEKPCEGRLNKTYVCLYLSSVDIECTVHSFMPESQQHERTYKLTCYKCSFQNYGISATLSATPCNTNSSKVRITQFSDSSEQREPAPSLFHNQTQHRSTRT